MFTGHELKITLLDKNLIKNVLIDVDSYNRSKRFGY